MRYLILVFLLIIAVVLYIDHDDEPDDLEEENEQLQEEVADLTFKVIDAGREVMEAQGQVQELENKLDELMHVGTVSVRGLDWEELKQFVKHDKTDSREYILNKFDCEGYAINLRDHANTHGYQCAYVSIGFEKGVSGHTLNAFDTKDYGLIYIDNTEQDAVGYLQTNRTYGTIAIDSVRKTVIDTSMDPEEFYLPISHTEFSGNIFEYGYYQDYLERYQFYSDSRDACNKEIDSYNVEIERYGQEGSALTRIELNSWAEKLDMWVDNLDALLAELGPVRTEEQDLVETIEIYWNEQFE